MGGKLAVIRQPSTASSEAFGLFTDNQQPTTNNQLPSQPITGHFRQKGARRRLPDPEPSRTFGSSLRIQTEKPGVFNNPFSDQPGVGTSMPISNWIGIADGLQAISNLQSEISDLSILNPKSPIQDHINLEPHHSLVKELLGAHRKSFGFETDDEIPPNAGESADNCRRRTHSSSLGTS